MAAELGVDSITIDHAYLPVTPREEAMKWLPHNPKYHRYDPAELEKRWQALEKKSRTPGLHLTSCRLLLRRKKSAVKMIRDETIISGE